MSHLRPIDPGTGAPKSIDQYTPNEVAAALTQLLDDANRRIELKLPIDQGQARLIVKWAKECGREATVPQLVADAAAGSKK